MLLLAVFVTLLAIVKTENSIMQIYFDPTTSMTKERRDGVVVIESMNGKKSTICTDNFTSNDARVICRMLKYSDDGNSYALISSKSSIKNSQLFYSNFSCRGNESSVTDCPTFQYQLAEPNCQTHENDVHVYCNSPRIVSKQFESGSKSECDRDLAELRSGTSNMGLMVLKSGSQSFTLCGRDNNFGENEARLFCKLLCFENLKSARIISNYYVRGASIGGFRRMKCSENATSLANCSMVYTDDSELCTPADNIGVACESQKLAPEPKPKLECNGDSMTLKWDKAIFPDVEQDFVNILSNGYNCTNVLKDSSNGFVSLKLKVDQCSPSISENKDNLIFKHKVRRLFLMKNNKVDHNTQNFDASCFIARKEVVGDTNIQLLSIDMNPAGNIISLETKLELSTTFDFSTILPNPYSLEIGTRIYGRIVLLNAPNQIQLVLQKCVVNNSANDSEVLIDERCAVRDDVKINPINDKVIKFNYRSFALRQENLPLSMKCETSKCGKYEVGCISSCQKP